MRVVLWTFALFIALSAGVPHAQGSAAQQSAEEPEEVIVRGKRLADFRVEVQLARERAYAIFNDINSTDDFDVTCREEMKTGTRLGRTVCAPRFEGRISSRAAKDYLNLMRALCPSTQGLTQECLFTPGLASRGIAAAKAVESEAPMQRDRLKEEIERLARTDLQFGQAILDFYDASVRYEEERKRPRERTRER